LNYPPVTVTGSTTLCQGESVVLQSAAAPSYQWFRDNVLIPGATQQSYAATQAGSYLVRITNTNGCQTFSNVPVIVSVNAAAPVPLISRNGNVLTSSVASGIQWFLNGNPVAGATSVNYSPTGNGTYTVRATVGNCSATSLPYNFFFTAINSPDLEAGMHIAPNPVKETLTIRYKGAASRFRITMMDMTGRTVYEASAVLGRHAVDVRKLSAGGYVVRIISERTGEQTMRMIIKE
jgi:hypothetical protein